MLREAPRTGRSVMRPCIAPALLAVFLLLTPVAAGFAPASSQDFSITNDITIEGAQLGPDWIKKLQEWWDLHRYYPREASGKNEAGTVKVHMLILQDGRVWLLKVVQGSGSKSIDQAAFWTFHNMRLQPFPTGTAAPQADVYLNLHYVLSNEPAKAPFTVTNAPIKNTVFTTWLQKNCTGHVVTGGVGRDHLGAYHSPVTVTFYRKPDGAPWAKWWGEDNILRFVPVVELGVSAQWSVRITGGGPCGGCAIHHYDVWPAGDNRLSGTYDNGGDGLRSVGTIDLACETEAVPAIKSNAVGDVTP